MSSLKVPSLPLQKCKIKPNEFRTLIIVSTAKNLQKCKVLSGELVFKCYHLISQSAHIYPNSFQTSLLICVCIYCCFLCHLLIHLRDYFLCCLPQSLSVTLLRINTNSSNSYHSICNFKIKVKTKF